MIEGTEEARHKWESTTMRIANAEAGTSMGLRHNAPGKVVSMLCYFGGVGRFGALIVDITAKGFTGFTEPLSRAPSRGRIYETRFIFPLRL